MYMFRYLCAHRCVNMDVNTHSVYACCAWVFTSIFTHLDAYCMYLYAHMYEICCTYRPRKFSLRKNRVLENQSCTGASSRWVGPSISAQGGCTHICISPTYMHTHTHTHTYTHTHTHTRSHTRTHTHTHADTHTHTHTNTHTHVCQFCTHIFANSALTLTLSSKLNT